MNKDTARKIADALTWARIWSAIPISVLAWYELRWWVFALYIAAALTDFFDGYFARRASPPATDIDLDGHADLLLSVMTLLWLWMLIPGFWEKYWLPYMPVLVVLELYIIWARNHYRDLRVPHLPYGRWAMALFFFLLPVLIVWGDVPWFVHLVFIAGTVGKMQVSFAISRLVRPRTSGDPQS